MWKILFLTLLLVAVASEAKFQLKGRQRQLLRQSVDEECQKNKQASKADQEFFAAMTAMQCLFDDGEFNAAFEKLRHINSSESFIDTGRAMCAQRHKIVPCYRVLLEAFMPCAPPSVQQQIESLQTSFEQLVEFICADDCRKVREFAEDGALDCIDGKTKLIRPCSANFTSLFIDIPEDTTTFAAIDTCFRFDSMVTCVTEVLRSCPKESTKNIMDSIFTLFRKGTYCHITLPLEKEEDFNKETTEKNIENNKL